MSTIIITGYWLLSLTHRLTRSKKLKLIKFVSLNEKQILPIFVNFPSLLNERSAVLLPLFP